MNFDDSALHLDKRKNRTFGFEQKVGFFLSTTTLDIAVIEEGTLKVFDRVSRRAL